jgi:hypothetical protein
LSRRIIGYKPVLDSFRIADDSPSTHHLALLGLYAYLREEEEQWTVHGVAADDTQKVAGEAE